MRHNCIGKKVLADRVLTSGLGADWTAKKKILQEGSRPWAFVAACIAILNRTSHGGFLLCSGASPPSVVDGSSIIHGGSPSASPPTMTSPDR